MIAIVFGQIASRWGQALTVLVLSLAATVAAVSAPAYAIAIGEAAVRNELAAADSSELVVSLPPLITAGDSAGTTAPQPPADILAYAEARSLLKGFLPLTTVQIYVQGLGQGKQEKLAGRRVLARDGFCERVRFQSGRCPVGSREIALPAALARQTGARPGQELVLTPAKQNQQEWQPDGPPSSLTLVGVYVAKHPDAAYWTPEDPLGRLGFSTPAILTNRTVLETIPHGSETTYLDAVVPPRLVSVDRVPVLRRQLAAANERLGQSGGAQLATDLPQLLSRITAQGDQARALLPIAAVPLLVLCWFVVYLAVGYGVSGRRHEVAVVGLHGARWWVRAVTFGGESLVPVLLGVPAGLGAAHLLVGAVGPAGLGRVPVDRLQLLAAALAAVGTLVAAGLALRRELAAPPVQLLRQVPPRPRRAVAAVVEVLAVALGLVVVVNLRVLDGKLVGVMVAAPVLVMLAVAVLAVLAARPVIDLVGRASLRRGRLAPAMAALSLARRQGSTRLLVVLALVLGTFGFAFAGSDVAAEGRVAQAQRALGADRVLELQPVDRAALVNAVRAADPDGRYAMAVVSAPSSAGGPPVLAVDAERLARVGLWPKGYDGPPPRKLAALLRPPARDPITVGDGQLVARLTPDPLTADGTLSVSLLLAPPEGDMLSARFGPISRGVPTYRDRVSGCADGCRLAAITVSTTDAGTGSIGVTVHGIREGGRDLLTSAWLKDADRWRPPEEGPVTEHILPEAVAGGLQLTQHAAETGTEYQVMPVDAPYPLPVVTAGRITTRLATNIDDQSIRIKAVARTNGLPGIGAHGVLMDLGYAERLTTQSGTAWSPEVWLAKGAPAGIVDRLRKQGLVIVADRNIHDLQASINRSGAAMALRYFELSAEMAVLVGLGALLLVVAVDRLTWARGLTALRAQGLASRTAMAAAIWSYGGMVLAGCAAGALAAVTAWFVTGGRLPLGVDKAVLAAWPRWLPVLTPWVLVVLVLVLAAVVGARWQRQSARGRGTQEVGG